MTQTIESFKVLASRIRHPDYTVEVGRDMTSVVGCEEGLSVLIPTDYYLRVHCEFGRCNVSGVSRPWQGRKWRLSPFMTDAEVVWTAFHAMRTADEHELREKFTFDGATVANSHVNIHRLVDFMLSAEAGEVRTPHD